MRTDRKDFMRIWKILAAIIPFTLITLGATIGAWHSPGTAGEEVLAPDGLRQIPAYPGPGQVFLPLTTRRLYSTPAETRLGYGAAIADLQHVPLLRDMGFAWVQGFVSWASVQPWPEGEYEWTAADDLIDAARRYHVKVLARVDRPPAWARLPGTTETGPVRADRLGDWAEFLRALSERGRGAIAAYEIWNEPNLAVEWGNLPPDPSYYTTILRWAYPAIKAGDPEAIVVSAGLATTGHRDDSVAMGDLIFLDRMYQHGARGSFDAVGTHPHGFGSVPEQDPPASGFAMRRAEQQRDVMLRYGDRDKPMWATEFGWALYPGAICQGWGDWPTRIWQTVSEETQADYLVRAYNYASQHWPWMQVMILFNLDFAADWWQGGCPTGDQVCNPARFYSLIERENPCDTTEALRFRRAYEVLRAMPKP